MNTATNIKRVASIGLGIIALGGISASVFAQSVPTGTLGTNTTLARVGASPTVNWSISYPQTAVTEVVSIGTDPGGDTGNGTDSTITAKTKLKVSVKVLGVAFGTGTTATAQLPCRLQMKTNNGSWTDLFVGRGSPVTNEVFPNTDLTSTLVLNANDKLDFQFCGASGKNRTTPRTPIKNYLSDWKWYSWVKTDSTSKYKLALKNGDTPPSYAPAYSNQSTIKTYLGSYVQNGKIKLGPRDVIFLTECSGANPGSSAFDMQDITWLVTFTETN